MEKKGQISIEYAILVGFIVFVVIGFLGFANLQAATGRDKIRVSQIEAFMSNILNSAEEVYYAGEPSKVTINAYLPEGVNSLEIVGRDIYINYSTISGYNYASYSGRVNMTGTLSARTGLKVIVVQAQPSGVAVSEI